MKYFVRYKYMGVIVHETITTETGIDISDYYVNLGEIKISKQPDNQTKFNVWTDYKCYANKAARTASKEPFQKFSIHIETETLNDIHAQIYNEIKIHHGNSTDDL